MRYFSNSINVQKYRQTVVGSLIVNAPVASRYTMHATHNVDNRESVISKSKESRRKNFTRREIVQCLGRAGNVDFFRENRMNALGNLNPWLRRSFISAFSCLSKSEREALFNSRKYIQQDYLESLVDKWAIKNHY